MVDAKQITDEIVKFKENNIIPRKNNVLCGLLSVWGLYPVTFLDLSSEEERVGKSFKVRTHSQTHTHTHISIHIHLHMYVHAHTQILR